MVVHAAEQLKIQRGTPARVEAFLRLLEEAGVLGMPYIYGVEIGVWRGGFSRWMLRNLPGLHLKMVDLWAPPPEDSPAWLADEPGARGTAEGHERHRQVALRNTDFAPNRRTVLQKESTLAAAGVADGTLDFVFIDGSHLYGAVLADLEAWAPKVRPGGVVGGHDWDHPLTCPGAEHFKVCEAVEAYLDKAYWPPTETIRPQVRTGADTVWAFVKE